MKIYGKNVALEALKENKKIHKIYLNNKFKDDEILSLIERKNINTKILDNRELDKMCKGLHQGIILEVEDIKTYSFDEIIPNITTEYPLIVILDHLEDPHNLGAMIRTANQAGASTVVKTSVGTIEKVKIVNVPNINNAIRKLKDLGYWIVGTDMEGTNYTEIDYKTKIGLVIGNEGKGISKVTTSNCDYIAKIPMKGTVNSLNASVACGIFLSEINRSRGI